MFRLLFTPVVAIALWLIFDGVRCLFTGHFTARLYDAASAKQASGVLVPLADGRFAEYGPWAFPFAYFTVDPAVMAPFFIALGVFGLLSLGLYYKRKRVGYIGLVSFAIVCLPYVYLGTILAGIALFALASKSIRAHVAFK